jgi:hypothetical protein
MEEYPEDTGERSQELEETGEELVLVETVRVIEPVRSSPPALAQAAAAAVTGFVAGAATVAVLSRRRGSPALLASRRPTQALRPYGEVQTFLVSVRSLRRP